MYSFVNKTRNYLAGACPHMCKYCFINDLKKKFPAINKKYSGEIRLIEKELKKNEGKGNFIFVQDMGDLFAWNVPIEAIKAILRHCSDYPENTYLFQSKNPERMALFKELYPPKTVLCTTIESNRDYNISKAPSIHQRAVEFEKLQFDKCLTLEPLMDFDLDSFVELIKFINPLWVNIGSDSKGYGLIEPSKEKILALIEELKKFTTVKLKENLGRLIK